MKSWRPRFLLNTRTHPFNSPLSRTTWVSRYQKGKPICILLKQETASGIGISWAVCKSAPCSRQITTPAPHHWVFLQAKCPSCRPTNSIKALKAPFLAKKILQIQMLHKPDFIAVISSLVSCTSFHSGLFMFFLLVPTYVTVYEERVWNDLFHVELTVHHLSVFSTLIWRFLCGFESFGIIFLCLSWSYIIVLLLYDVCI